MILQNLFLSVINYFMTEIPIISIDLYKIPFLNTNLNWKT